MCTHMRFRVALQIRLLECVISVAVYVCSLTLLSDSRHLQSAPNKAFQHVKVDTLCQPEAMSSVAVPGECDINAARWKIQQYRTAALKSFYFTKNDCTLKKMAKLCPAHHTNVTAWRLCP